MNTTARRASPQARPSAPRLSPEQLGEELGALLNAMTSAYQRLHAANLEQRESVRLALPSRLADATRLQERLLTEISALDGKRRELVALAASGFTELRSRPASALTLSDLAQSAPAPARQDLLRRAADLRTLVQKVQAQNSSMHAIAQGLLTHVESVLRQVAMTLSHSGTYGPRGYVEAGGPVTTSLDLRS